ncbi:hypothetical protein BH23DEI1_BH23DEI1_23460 [soil metagenome]|nr:hypothetical protein [Trueperaceae bacterium]
MIRLTVLYNLPADADEEEFLRWRLTDHQAANAAAVGVVRTDFARVDAAWPPGTPVPYRFMTTADWPDRASFERAFLDDEAQEGLRTNLTKLADPVFLVSEILAETVNAPD